MIVGSLCLNEWAFIHYGFGGFSAYNAWTDNVGGAMDEVAGLSGISYSSYTYPIHTSRLMITYGVTLVFAGFFSHLAIVAMLLNSGAAPVIALLPVLIDVAYWLGFDVPQLAPGVA